MVNPRILLLLGAAVLVLSSAIAVFFAIGYRPDPRSDYSRAPAAPAAPVTETSTLSFQPPPPPIMMPGPGGQVPCMGWTAEGCDQNRSPATSSPSQP
jgi:hypothetical protein